MLERHREAELMDDPNVDPDLHREAMLGLARINTFSRSAAMTLAPILKILADNHMRSARILDIATGGGDMPFHLWKEAKRAGVALIIDGCDQSPVAIQSANELATSLAYPGKFFTLNVNVDDFPVDYDIVINSLFMHHLDPDQVVILLEKMKGACKLMLVVNDLVRGYLNLFLVSVAARLLSKSSIVHFDSVASVRAAYTPSEMRLLANKAGLEGANISSQFPCRMILTWSNRC